jgi:hypothetical protein
MKIKSIIKPNYEHVLMESGFEYRRYFDGSWTYIYGDAGALSCVEQEPDKDDIEELEKLYQEFKRRS